MKVEISNKCYKEIESLRKELGFEDLSDVCMFLLWEHEEKMRKEKSLSFVEV